jgi:hypothetical protein
LWAFIYEGSLALGVILINHVVGDAGFNDQHRRRPNSIILYVAHVLASPSLELEALLVDSDDEGLLIVKAIRRIQHRSLTPAKFTASLRRVTAVNWPTCYCYYETN